MKHNLTLTISSLLAFLFLSLHLTSDAVDARAGSPEAGGVTLICVPIMVVWLVGILVLSGRRSGYIINLVGSLLGFAMPIFHVVGPAGVFHGVINRSSRPFVFIWTLHALGVTSMFSIILSVMGLWSLRRSEKDLKGEPLHARGSHA